MTSQLDKKSFFGAAIGTLVEYYDYALFLIFLPLLSPVFFPADSAYQSLVKGYVIMSIAMLARPLGGLLFGYLGDRFGRRKALLGSMYGIAIATLAIGITPSYAQIGILATIIITFAKAVQTFCFGGEYIGAGIYVVEHAKNNRESFIGSLLAATTIVGALLASLVGVIMTLPGMPASGFRIAFILGSFIALFGIFYRKNMLESPAFEKDKPHHSIKTLFKLFPSELWAGFWIGGFAITPFVTVLTFISPVLMSQGLFNSHQFMLFQTLFNLAAITSVLGVGYLADKTSPTSMIRFGCVGLILLTYPLLYMVDHGNLTFILIALISFIIINEICLGASSAYLKNIFPSTYRCRGASLSFSTGMSLFGGIAPLLESYLFHKTGHFTSISVLLIFIGLGTFISLSRIQRKNECEPLVAASP